MLSVYLACVIYIAIFFCFTDGHSCKPEEIQKVDLHKHCSDVINVTSAVAIFPTNHLYDRLTPCFNCSLTLIAEDDQQLTVTFYNLGLYNNNDRECPLSRLDVFDGHEVNNDTLLSNTSGICGCQLPNQIYRSSSNAVTIHLTTACNISYIHGQFDIIVSAFNPGNGTTPLCPGEFQCRNKYCVDKNDVCNERNDCGDNSDEENCKPRTVPKKWMTILIILASICALFLLIIIILLCYRYCYSKRGSYEPIPSN